MEEKSPKHRELEKKVEALERTCEILMDKLEFFQDKMSDNFSVFEKNFQLNKKIDEDQAQLQSLASHLNSERDKLTHILRSLPGHIIILDLQGKIIESYRGIDFPQLGTEDKEMVYEVFNKDFYNRILDNFSHPNFKKYGVMFFNYHFKNDFFDVRLSVGISALRSQYIVLSLRDVTQHEVNRQKYREQEAQLVQSSKLASLGEMAGGIAHEINNPLTVLASRAQILSRRIEENKYDEKTLVESLGIISKMTKRITEITNSMRKLSRDSSKEAKTSIYVKDLVHDIKAICFEKFMHKGIKFEIVIAPFFDDHKINVYPGELSQVIINLLNNAYDAVEDCDVKEVELSFSVKDKNLVQIKVRDSGAGVAQEIKDKIFTPFFTTKDVGRGTGLGLGLSKAIIEKHQGRFFLDDKDVKTCFIIELVTPTE